MAIFQKTCHVRSLDALPNDFLDFLGLAEQGGAFRRPGFIDLEESGGVLQERPGRRVAERLYPSAFFFRSKSMARELHSRRSQPRNVLPGS